MEDKALGLLGLARKGQLLAIGEEPVSIACRSRKAKLLLIAKDAGDHTFRRARSFCYDGKPAYLCAPFTKEELGNALGCNACALCAILDPAMAKAFVEALGQPEKYQEIIAELDRQAQRVKKRRQEQKAHQNNIKYGKK